MSDPRIKKFGLTGFNKRRRLSKADSFRYARC